MIYAAEDTNESTVEDGLDEVKARGLDAEGRYSAAALLVILCGHPQHGRKGGRPEIAWVFHTQAGPLLVARDDEHWAVPQADPNRPFLHHATVALVQSDRLSHQVTLRCPKHGARQLPDVPKEILNADISRIARRVKA